MRSNSRAAAACPDAAAPAPVPPEVAVRLRGVRVAYGRRLALDTVSLDLP